MSICIGFLLKEIRIIGVTTFAMSSLEIAFNGLFHGGLTYKDLLLDLSTPIDVLEIFAQPASLPSNYALRKSFENALFPITC
jgi:hypothetical protein